VIFGTIKNPVHDPTMEMLPSKSARVELIEPSNFVTPIMKPDAMDRGELLDRVMNNYRRFYMKKALFNYPWQGFSQRGRYLLGCLKAYMKAGFERKFYDLGKVDYWGPQSRKKVHFDFDTTRKRAADEDVEWQTTHNRPSQRAARKPVGRASMEPAMACGGGRQQMAESLEPMTADCGCDGPEPCACEDHAQPARNAKEAAPNVVFTRNGARAG
jgi:anaerobic magnesium-protoporphyrin IX monomethyl ester cyclase